MNNFDDEFQKFIDKWCEDSAPHLSDTDENDGQELRDFVKENYLFKELVRAEIENVINHGNERERIIENYLLKALNIGGVGQTATPHVSSSPKKPKIISNEEDCPCHDKGVPNNYICNCLCHMDKKGD